jgi:putative selenium metabolism hydrolase
MRSLPLFSQPASGAKSTVYRDLALPPEERNQMIAFLRDLARTPSLSGDEGAVAALIVDFCRESGMQSVRVDDAGNVLVTVGDGRGATLLYDAHMDTVTPPTSGWPYPPFEAVVQEDILYGLGACDTKASIAAMIFAARRLLQARVELHGALMLAFVVQEEPCEGCGLKALIENNDLKPDWVILGEPSNMEIMRGHRGRALFKVTVHGKSSHASNPQLGDNAVSAAARLIFGIELLAANLPSDPFLGVGTVAVTHIESQSASMNAIPHTCCFYVDRRLTLGETPTRAQAQLEAIIQREDIRAEVAISEFRADTYSGYRLATKEEFRPWALEEHHRLVEITAETIKSVSGHAPRIGEGAFSTDGVYSMGVAGIPTVGFGPGDPQHAHTSLEQVRLADVATAAHIYGLLAANLLGAG